ncbi:MULTISPECIES: hypothetical protein [Brevibacterium]|uniref:Uncharacterized protein n=1 Tax=Brevibacterium salitolerans TaxID=1403566 RepID=A0ABP5HXN6_9MICO|nr:hypothetical protein [Brevibacterium sp.]
MAEQEQGPPGGRRPVRRPRAGSFRADGHSHPPLEVLRAKACRERVEGWLRELENGREVVIHTRVRDSAAAGLLVWAVCALLVWLLLGSAMSPLRFWEAQEGTAAASCAEAAAIVVIGLLTAVFVLVLAWGGVLLVVWVPWTRPELVVTQEALSSVGARWRMHGAGACASC